MKVYKNHSLFFIPPSSFQGGFTLIELLLVAAILALMTGAGLAAFRSFEERQKLIQEARNFKSNLRSVQIAAQTGTQPSDGCTTVFGVNVGMKSIRLQFDSSTAFTAETVCTNDSVIGAGKIYSMTQDGIDSGISYTTTQTPIEFLVLSGGVTPADTTICVNDSAGRTYKLAVTTAGEIHDEGLVSSCP